MGTATELTIVNFIEQMSNIFIMLGTVTAALFLYKAMVKVSIDMIIDHIKIAPSVGKFKVCVGKPKKNIINSVGHINNVYIYLSLYSWITLFILIFIPNLILSNMVMLSIQSVFISGNNYYNSTMMVATLISVILSFYVHRTSVREMIANYVCYTKPARAKYIRNLYIKVIL